MFNTKDIKEDYPVWEDRVKYLFRLNENNEVVRNDNLDPAYFYDSRRYGRYLNHIDKKYLSRTITNFGEVYITYEVLFYLYYGYKPKRLFNSHPKDLPVLSNLIPIDSELPVKSGERFDSKPFAIQYMNECFYLKDGLLYFNERPFTHFKSWKEWKTWNEKYAHKNEMEQFSFAGWGYKIMSINGIGYQVHRMKIQVRDQIMLSKDVFIDHINRDISDNSFENLRYASPALNTKNRAKTKNLKSSRFKGVHFVTKSRKWRAMCQDGTDIRIIGYFNTEAQAAEAYDNYVTCLGLYHTSNKDLGLFD